MDHEPVLINKISDEGPPQPPEDTNVTKTDVVDGRLNMSAGVFTSPWQSWCTNLWCYNPFTFRAGVSGLTALANPVRQSVNVHVITPLDGEVTNWLIQVRFEGSAASVGPPSSACW